MIATAILEAKTLHDVGAEIRYLSASGTAWPSSVQHRVAPIFRSGPRPCESKPGYRCPISALLGKGKGTDRSESNDRGAGPRGSRAEEAREKEKRVKEAQFLITSSTISESAGQHDRSIELLEEAAEISKTGGFRRLLETA